MGRDVQYQIYLRRGHLLRLYAAWERTIVGVPMGEHLPEWGLTDDEVAQARVDILFGGGVGLIDDGGYDVEFEQDADQLLVEHLESIRISENYREREGASGIIV